MLTDCPHVFDILDYESKSPYFGAICGRVANIIKPPEFELDGEKFTLFPNRPPVTVHGGKEGFDKVEREKYLLLTQLVIYLE